MRRKKLIIFLIVGIIVLLSGGTTLTLGLNGYFGGGGNIPSDTATRGLVGYWAFEEGTGSIAADASGNGNDGTLTNMEPETDWVAGKSGNGSALKFATNDHVQVSATGFLPTGDFTYSAWVNMDVAQDQYIMMAMSQADNQNEFIMKIDSSSNVVVGLNQTPIAVSSQALSAGTWYHLVATRLGSDVTLFINGVIDGTGSEGATLAFGNCYFLIGTDSDTNGNNCTNALGNYMDGTIDEVRVYNRALSAAEIRFMYNRGGPVGHWKFDEGSGGIAYDSSGNNNNGTLTQMDPATDWVTGKYGTALDFDGVDDYVSIPDSSIWDTGGEVTASVWIKTVVPNQTGINLVLHDDSNYKWLLYFSGGTDDDDIQMYVRTASGVSSTSCQRGDGEIADGSWYHIVGTYDRSRSSGRIKTYINGVECDSEDGFDEDILDGDQGVYIGRWINAGNNSFDGLIDDVRIYDYARTAGEILLDYNAGFGAHFGGSPSKDVERGLVGYWAFEEGTGTTAADASDNSNTGTLTNMDQRTDWTAGKPGNGGALDFDGTNDYVDLGTGLDQNGEMTITAWVNTDTLTGSARSIVVNSNSVGTTTDYNLSINDTDGKIAGQWGGASVVTSNTVPLGTWIHVAFVRSGTTSAWTGIIYIDGVENDLATTSANPNATNETTAIGRWGSYTGLPDFDGKIDEVRIYNRALGADEIRYLYNKGGPVGHWKFDEGSGGIAYDSSGNGNNGTLFNMEDADWVQGRYGTALDFDGNWAGGDPERMTRTTNDESNRLVLREALTIGAWINPDGTGDSTETIVRHGTLTDNIFSLFFVPATRRLNFEHHDSSAFRNFVVDDVIDLDKWQYVTAVRESDGVTIHLYVDGVLVGSGILAGAPTSSTPDSINIAGHPAAQQTFGGRIDDVRIYDYVRTLEEIRLDYNAGLAAHFGGSPSKDVERGLVGYWNFEEGTGTTAADGSDQGNTGTLTNMEEADWVRGKKGNGSTLDFDGVDEHVNVGTGLDLNGEMAITAWINTDSVATATDSIVVNSTSSSSNADYNFLLNAITGSRLGGGWAGVEVVTSNASISIGTWTHVAFVRTGVTGDWTATLYINGAEDNSATTATNPNETDGTTSIGRWGTSATDYFDGKIDEVRIYNRALGADEIRYLYNKGGPVGHWKFDEGSGTTAFDSTDNNNDGTITGTTWVQGKYGTALDFDGTGDGVDAGTNLELLADWTVSAWVKKVNNSGTQAIVGRGGSGTAREYVIYFGGTGNFRAQRSEGAGATTLPSPNVLPVDKWHHVVATFDATTGEGVLFENGVQVASGDLTEAVASATRNTTIGNLIESGSNTFFFTGQIDDVKIYNYVRTADEIKQDYNAGFSTHFR